MQTHYMIPNAVNRGIFRAYDIRGIVGQGIDEATVYVLGLAIGHEIVAQSLTDVVVGRDARKSSNILIHALHQGLIECGLNVIDIGEVTSPMLYFATYHLQVPSGVMLTASHNPPEYNGLKIVINGTSLTKDRIEHLYEQIINQNFYFADVPGQLQYQDIFADYFGRITNDIKLQRKLKIVIDCGNSIAGKIAPKIFNYLGCEVIPLFCEVDGSFPNHIPDPSVASNMADLQQKVLQTKADIGLAFDGDADRVGVVSEKGLIIWPDQLMLLFSKAILEQYPNGEIIFDVKCTAHLPTMIEQWGGQPVMWQTGHSLLKNRLHQTSAPLAGEMSGHIFYNDRWYGFDDGVYVGARLLELIASQSQSVSQVFAQFPQAVNTPELKLLVAEEAKFLLMEIIAAEAKFTDAKIVTIDGLRIEFSYGWGLVRASNTSPCLTLRFEADTEENLLKVQQQIGKELLRLGASNLPFAIDSSCLV